MVKGWNNLLFFLASCFVQVWSREVISDGFLPYGLNVCKKTIVANKPVKVLRVSHFRENRKTSCGVFGWARCTVNRIATKSKYVFETEPVPVDSLYCCFGWRSTNLGKTKMCNIPICQHGCKHGKCVGADRCKCYPGWSGYMCERDVNECSRSNGNCQHVCTNTPGSYKCGCKIGYVQHTNSSNICIDLDECKKNTELCKCANDDPKTECGAVCTNVIGSYKCSCGKGYTKLGNSALCRDVDECLYSNNCTFKCYNIPGSYLCDCMRGFRLLGDGTTCEDINECALINGGCTHMCLNAYGTFRCRCRFGFKLHINRLRCIDVDECSIFNPCQMHCKNTIGSYYCSCPQGYTLDNNKFTCTDVDECSLRKVKGIDVDVSLSYCEQQCINTVGSYNCLCKRGYLLKISGKACEDVNECQNGIHRCDQKCHNIIGSYVCSCGPGYRLNSDKRTCRALSCESIESPLHGHIKCDGYSTATKCLMNCDFEYKIIGSKERTCLPSGKWNGTKTICEVKRCSQLSAPENAEVLLPCRKTLHSRCSLECLDGLYSQGDGIATCELDSSSGLVDWNLNKFKCSKLRFCQPNPCLNGGKCVIRSMKDKFYCNCEGTGFEGLRCQTGIITTPIYQRLNEANKESKVYHLYARPKNELIVNIRSTQAILVKPQSELQISTSSQQADFSLVPKKPGLHVISYTLSGGDAKVFKVPEDNMIFVGPDSVKKHSAVYTKLQLSRGSLPDGCHELPKDLFQCNARLSSTLPWGTTPSNDKSTEGIVHLQAKNIKVPISLFGADLSDLSTTREKIFSKIEAISLRDKQLGMDLSFNRNGKCQSIPMKKGYLFEFIQSDALPRSIFGSLSSLMPKWIQFELDQSNDVFDVTNLMVSVGKPNSDGSGMCEQLPISTASIFFKPSIAFTTKLGDEIKKFQSIERACFALDVCQSKMFVDLSLQARKKIQQMRLFKYMKTAGWNFRISSFGIQGSLPSATVERENFDMWMEAQTQVSIAGPRVAVALNMTGEIFTKSECPKELFVSQFTCTLSGSVKGRIAMNTLIKIKNSNAILLKFNSEIISGKFFFGGGHENIKSCHKQQGIKLQLKSSRNPLQGSVLSHFIIPYLKYPMNVTINHDISGGGKTDVRISPYLKIKLTHLGYVAQDMCDMWLKRTAKNVYVVAPELSSDGAELLRNTNDMNALVSKTTQLVTFSLGKTLKNKEARRFKRVVRRLKKQIAQVLTLASAFSKKLSSHRSNPQVQGLKSELQILKKNLKRSAKSTLKLDIKRSPVKQNLKGVSIGMMAHVCIGMLCIPYVRTTILANNDDTSSIVCPTKNINHGPKKQQTNPYILISPSKNIKLGRVLQVKEGETMRFNVFKKLIQFKSTISLFGMTKVATLNITEQQLNINVKGSILSKFEAEINITADTKVDEWESLIFKASGRMGQDSRLTRMLEKSVNQYASILVRKSEKRIQNTRLSLENTTTRIENVKKLLELKRTALELLRGNGSRLTSLENKYMSKLQDYDQYSALFDEVFDTYNQTKLENSRKCNLTECKKECIKTCVPDVCWDRVAVQYQKQDCFTVKTTVSKLIPEVMSIIVDYVTTPAITRDVGKCKSFLTRFVEETLRLLAYDLLSVARGKRSLRNMFHINDTLRNQIPDINEYLKASNPKLPHDFDINVELRKQIANLPNDFDMKKALKSYILKQHFDVNEILKEHFPALSPDFDVNQVLEEVVPEFKRSFNFDNRLKDAALKAQRLKKPTKLNVSEILKNAVPIMKMFGDLDINSVISGAFPNSLTNFDISKLLKDAIPAFRGGPDVGKLLSEQLKERVFPEVDKLLTRLFPVSLPNITDVLKDVVGEQGLAAFQKLLNAGGVFRILSSFKNMTSPIDRLRGNGMLSNILSSSKYFHSPNSSMNFFQNFAENMKNVGENPLKVLLTPSNLLTFGDGFMNASSNSGCKHKYVTELGKTEKLKYEKKIPIYAAKELPELRWHCNNSQTANITSEGYEPKSCCKKNIKCVYIQNRECVKKLKECFNTRETLYQLEQSVLSGYSREYDDLVNSEKVLLRVGLQLEKARLREKNASQDYQIIKAPHEQLLALKNTRETLLSKIKSVPEVKLGLKIKSILEQSYEDRPLRIAQLSFETVTSSLSKSRLPLKGMIKTKTGPDMVFNFIMDFENILKSLDDATKTIIQVLGTESSEPSRKRRSVDLKFSNSRKISEPLERDSCLWAQNSSYFFNEILGSLKRLLDSNHLQDSEISKEVDALEAVFDLNSGGDDSNSEDNLLKGYNEVISTYKKQRSEQSKMMTWNAVILGWKNFVENVTRIRQLTNCAGAIDCVEELGERLVELYKPLVNSTKAKEIRNFLRKLTEGIKELLEEELPMAEVKSKLPNLLILLRKSNSNENVLCGEKPVMLTNDNRQIKLLVGESTKLSCLAASQTEMIYTWKRDDTIIKVSKNGELDLRSLNETSQGLYRCEAANHMGSTLSGITALVVQSKPNILEHPVDVQVPLDQESGVSLSCVVSGKPLPTIKWLFKPFSSKLSVELTNEDRNLLYVVPDDVEKSGFYYCEASNDRGTIVSRKARLDVLNIAATNPKVAVIFNATNTCAKPSCQGHQVLNIPARLDKALKKRLTKTITNAMNVSIKSVTNLRYIRTSISTAKIFFYLSENIMLNIKDHSPEDVMEEFAQARLNLVGKFKRLLHAMNKTTFPTGKSRANIVGLSETLGFLHMEPNCPQGQFLHDNGYICVQCPPGTFNQGLDGACVKCPIGTYQPRAGQQTCINCGPDKTTLHRSTIYQTKCMPTV